MLSYSFPGHQNSFYAYLDSIALMCRMQKNAAIAWPEFEWEQNEMINEIKFRWINRYENVSLARLYFSQFVAISCLIS